MRCRRGNVFAADAPPNRVGNRPKARVRAISMPAFQGDRLDLPETERWLDGVQAERQIRTSPLSPPRFVADEMPTTADRPFAPGNDYASGGLEMLLDLLLPVRSAGNVKVPPEGKAFGLQRFDERDQPRPILRLVRNEYVRSLSRHGSPQRDVGVVSLRRRGRLTSESTVSTKRRRLMSALGRKLTLGLWQLWVESGR